MLRLFQISIALVILGHVVFAGMQAFAWDFVAERLIAKPGEAFVPPPVSIGLSFASYNFSIAVGLALSFFLPETVRSKVQLTVLALIVFTAIVGYIGTGSLVILLGRLLPAAVACLSLFAVMRRQ
jgi:uncharacterized membrane protein